MVCWQDDFCQFVKRRYQSHCSRFIYCLWLLPMIHDDDNLGICLMILLRQAISTDWCRIQSLCTSPQHFTSAESLMWKPKVLFWFQTKHVLDELCPREALFGFMGHIQLPATLKMVNQHINDCIIESTKKNINSKVHYINWTHPHDAAHWLQSQGRSSDKWKTRV